MRSGKNISTQGANYNLELNTTTSTNNAAAAPLPEARSSTAHMTNSSFVQYRNSELPPSNAAVLSSSSTGGSSNEVGSRKRTTERKKKSTGSVASQYPNPRRATISGSPMTNLGRSGHDSTGERVHRAPTSITGGSKQRVIEQNLRSQGQHHSRRMLSGDQLAAVRRDAADRRLSSVRRRERRVDARLVEVRNHIDDVHASVVQSLHDAVVSAMQHYSQSVHPQDPPQASSSAFSTQTMPPTAMYQNNNSLPNHTRQHTHNRTSATTPRSSNR